MKETVEHWEKKYAAVTGSEKDYFIAIHPEKPDYVNEFYHRQKVKSFKTLLKRCPSPKGKYVLDIGCGPGIFSKRFHELGARVVGIDISEKLIERNKRLLPSIEFLVMSGDKLEFPDNTFDLVNTMMVLQHIPYDEQQQAISEICRVIKRGGYIMIVESIYAKDRSPFLFPMPPEGWTRSFKNYGGQPVHFHGMEYVLLNRFVAMILGTLVKLTRLGTGNAGTDQLNAEHTKRQEQDRSQKSSLKRRILEHIQNGIIYCSYPLEPVFSSLVPNRLAIRGAFVFRKE